MLPQIQWAIDHKADFLQLQRDRGIPALWAAAQHVHEAFNGDGSMSGLLANYHNGGGLKWANWQRQYGCKSVSLPTSEWIGGRMQQVTAEFCHAPDFPTWLKVYGHLLTLDLYKPALRYAADPFLYGATVWAAGYATDPAYVVSRRGDGSAGGVYHWMAKLFEHFEDTLPGQAPTAPMTAPVLLDGREIGTALIIEGRSYLPVRAAGEALGLNVHWDGKRVMLSKGA